MSQTLQRYQSAMFDSDHWTRVHLRPGDVVISTPPKSGTTWTLAMTYLLLNGWDAALDDLSGAAPWIDHRGASAAPSGPGRRLFKTHTPLDDLPIMDGVSYICVFRAPGAAFLSMRRHLANMRRPIPNHPNAGPWSVAFERFLKAPLQPAHFGGITLAALKRYLDCAEASATLTLHYGDMVADQKGVLQRLRDHLALTLTDKSLRQILIRTSRRYMAAHADSLVPEGRARLFIDDAHFFTSAEQSKEQFDLAELDALESRLRSLIGAHLADWLLRNA